jgi:uncharacterized membrane protein
MQHVKQIPVYLLALVFIVFGLNFFMNFMPMPTEMPELQKKFMGVMAMESKYMTAIKVLEIIGGLLLLVPSLRGLALCIIVPIVVNIFFFEIFIAKAPGIGIALLVISALAIYFNKEKFAGILPKV